MSIVSAILTALSVLLTGWQWVCGLTFPLHTRHPARRPLAGVTLLKPIRGWDEETTRSLESWLTQDYPGEVQVLFGIDDDDAEAQAGARRLMAEFPERQARTIRVCQPIPYFFSILNNVTLWSALWLLASPKPVTIAMVAVALILRISTALHNEFRLCRSRPSWKYLWAIPLKDLLHLTVWAGAFLGNTVRWRGERFVLRSGGRLERAEPVAASSMRPADSRPAAY